MIQSHRGVVFKTVGDCVHAVFVKATDALAAALAAQRALQAEAWGETGPCACAWRCTPAWPSYATATTLARR